MIFLQKTFQSEVRRLLWTSQSAYANLSRWLLTLIISLASWILLVTVLSALLGFLAPNIFSTMFNGADSTVQNDLNLKQIYQNLYNLALLALYVPILSFSLWMVKLPLRRLINSKGRVHYFKIFLAAILTIFISVLSLAINYYYGASIAFQPWDEKTTGFALLFLIVVIFQASAEELLIRGVILQALGKLTRSFWILLLLPSALFWLLHVQNQELTDIGAHVHLLYFSLGLILTGLALLTGRLEYSIGMHIGNNLFVFLFIDNLAYPNLENPIGLFKVNLPIDIYAVLVSIGLFFLTALMILITAKIRLPKDQ